MVVVHLEQQSGHRFYMLFHHLARLAVLFTSCFAQRLLVLWHNFLSFRKKFMLCVVEAWIALKTNNNSRLVTL